MSHPILSGSKGEKHLLLGNEAIVRGALEAGVNVVTCYPGTPSSEVPDTFYRLSSADDSYYFEYSVNEKVALEVGAGAALSGALTLVTMKHVGVNVAADPLLTMTYTGLPGGLLLLSADDPGCHSSQNEQDNRYYARMAGIPCFEPATAQEIKEMTKEALLLARKTQQPVMLRTTTRVNHLRGPVTFDNRPEKPAEVVDFERNPFRFVPVPAVARLRHPELLKNLESIRDVVENSPWNTIKGEGKIGIITSGIVRAYVADVLEEEGWADKTSVLELGMTYPLPEALLEDFIKDKEKVIVLEELEPILETELRALAQEKGIDVEIVGKGEVLTRLGEYSTDLLRHALAEHFNVEIPCKECTICELEMPVRPPNLCAGCSHRAVYYAVRKLFGDDAYYSSDIGCYTLGMLPPLKAADFLFCMGSSVSSGGGFAKGSGKDVVAFIGDSTFFHSGITGLVNAVFNRHDVLLVVLDNGTTAMTGHQLNPGVAEEVLGDDRVHVDIESVVRGCGVTEVAKVKPFNLKGTMKTFEEMKAKKGVRVIIAEEPCILFARRLGKAKSQVAYVAEQTDDLQAMLETFACPAFYRNEEGVHIDEALCNGCMVCLQVSKGVKARKKGA